MNLNTHNNKKTIIRSMFISAAVGLILTELSRGVSVIIDGIIISQYLGSNALTASGMSGVCFSLMSLISVVIAVGAQNIYCDDVVNSTSESSNDSFAKAFTLTIAISVIVMILSISVSGLLASAVGAPASVGELHYLVRNNMIGIFIGAPAFIMIPVLIPAVQLNGDNRLITLSIIVMIAANFAGDMLNVLVIHGGIFGMALASSISYYLCAAVLLISFLKKESLFKLGIVKPNLSMAFQIINSGLPNATKRACSFLLPFYLNNMIMLYGGSMAMTAYSVEQNLRIFTECFGLGIANAASLLLGIFITEQDPVCVRHTSGTALRYIIAGISTFSLLYFFAAPLLVRIYLPTDSASFEMAIFILRCHAIGLPFLAFNEYYFNVAQAAKYMKLTHAITILHRLVCFAASSFVFSLLFGIKGIWIAIPFSELLLCGAIVICTAIRNRKNPMRIGKFSFIDDKEDETATQVEISIKSPEDLPSSQAQIVKFCKENGFNKKITYMIQLFFEEVCMLAIQHGFDGKKDYFVEIRILHTDEDIVLRTKDNCKSFTYAERQLMKSNYDNDDYIGINMVTKLAKDVNYVNMMNVNNFIVVL